ncbi:hypothetical protein, partial [Vibrio parahaemolyticus]
ATVLHNKTSRELNIKGLRLISISLLSLAFVIEPKTPSYHFYVALIPIGIGCGFIATKINLVINQSVGITFAGQSSGAQVSAKNIGYVLGVISFGMLLTYLTKYEFVEVVTDNMELFNIDNVVIDGFNFMDDKQVIEYFERSSIIYDRNELIAINNFIKAKSMSTVLLVGSVLTILSI